MFLHKLLFGPSFSLPWLTQSRVNEGMRLLPETQQSTSCASIQFCQLLQLWCQLGPERNRSQKPSQRSLFHASRAAHSSELHVRGCSLRPSVRNINSSRTHWTEIKMTNTNLITICTYLTSGRIQNNVSPSSIRREIFKI